MKRSLPTFRNCLEPIPAAAGIGLRGTHHEAFLHDHPPAAWLEVHSENYFVLNSVAAAALIRIREDYPVSLHGVGLSLGSVDPLDMEHLEKLKHLIERVEPGLVSEHLSWSSFGGRHTNDLLPLPRTVEALDNVVARIIQIQEFLGRRISIENISSYMEFGDSMLTEHEFLVEVARRSECGILLDINNIYVNAHNHRTDAFQFIESIPVHLVTEFHLAGHSTQRFGEHELLIDTHNSRVCTEVWMLYRQAVRRFGRIPTLIEWDSDLPALEVLLEEADLAQRMMDECHAIAA